MAARSSQFWRLISIGSVMSTPSAATAVPPRPRLPRPRRAAQRLRRLAERTDEGAAHPLRIAKAGELRDALDRLTGGLHALARHLDPQALHRLRRRGAGLRDEGAGEMPRTHAGLLGQVLDGERRIEMLARPGEQRSEA